MPAAERAPDPLECFVIARPRYRDDLLVPVGIRFLQEPEWRSRKCDRKVHDGVRHNSITATVQKESGGPPGPPPSEDGNGRKKTEVYAASSTGSGSRSLATFRSLTMPRALKSFSVIQEMSNSYHARPWRAETGCAWWLLCQPSPNVRSATHQLLRESSRVS